MRSRGRVDRSRPDPPRSLESASLGQRAVGCRPEIRAGPSVDPRGDPPETTPSVEARGLVRIGKSPRLVRPHFREDARKQGALERCSPKLRFLGLRSVCTGGLSNSPVVCPTRDVLGDVVIDPPPTLSRAIGRRRRPSPFMRYVAGELTNALCRASALLARCGHRGKHTRNVLARSLSVVRAAGQRSRNASECVHIGVICVRQASSTKSGHAVGPNSGVIWFWPTLVRIGPRAPIRAKL